MKKNIDYVLGTDLTEINRLKLQHDIWKPHVLDCWKRAKIKKGSKVIDLGSGPGYASIDLSGIVGKKGEVFAIERSLNFNNYLSNYIKKNKIQNIKIFEKDLMLDELPKLDADYSWCRWVICFVNNPKLVLKKLNKSLKKGGKAIFWEYISYHSFTLIPSGEPMRDFVNMVIKNWRASGGEPNISNKLPQLLKETGFKICSYKPHIFTVKPSDEMWKWPFTFVMTHVDRLLAQKKVTSSWAQKIKNEVLTAAKNPNSFFLTPIVLEIVAEKI